MRIARLMLLGFFGGTTATPAHLLLADGTSALLLADGVGLLLIAG
jgi:hypothetical protein